MVRLVSAGLFACVALANIEYVLNDTPHNESVATASGNVTAMPSRRQRAKMGRSTSSSGDESSSKASSESLDMSGSDTGSSDLFKAKKGIIPKSSIERIGWRKWHRKCHKCFEDMALKWRDPRVQWICGAYQRARRTFKSACMMHYRNCQDGTMFVEIYKGRCAGERYHGEHFFYEYAAVLSDDSPSDNSDVSSEESHVLTY